jgi:hypothetical protein
MSNPHATYQLVRSQLAFLRLKATIEAVAEHLDQADGQSHFEFLERLLRVEVDATAARRHASLLRWRCARSRLTWRYSKSTPMSPPTPNVTTVVTAPAQYVPSMSQ